jgi:hypothetical protein
VTRMDEGELDVEGPRNAFQKTLAFGARKEEEEGEALGREASTQEGEAYDAGTRALKS